MSEAGHMNSLRENTVAVTGATGFIGRHLMSRLAEESCSVRYLVRGRYNETFATRVDRFTPVPGELSNADVLDGLINGADVVFHLAGYAHASNKPDPTELQRHVEINLHGTQQLFRSAVRGGVKHFVYVSSVKAGGEDPRECLDEAATAQPQEPYGQIRRQAEEWLFEQGQRDGIGVVVLRPALVYGEGVKGNIAAMLRAVDRGWFPPVPETHNIRSMICVHDVLDGILSAATRVKASGQVIILTDGEAYSTRRIYSAMCAALGKTCHRWGVPARALRMLGVAGDVAETVMMRELPINSRIVGRLLDSACYRSLRAETLLGFRPRFCLEDALPGMIEAYRQFDR